MSARIDGNGCFGNPHFKTLKLLLQLPTCVQSSLDSSSEAFVKPVTPQAHVTQRQTCRLHGNEADEGGGCL